MSFKFFTDKPLYLNKPQSVEYINQLFNGNFCGMGSPEPTTQKARGIIHLLSNKVNIAYNIDGWKVPNHLLFKAGEEFSDNSFNYPVFARPCPVVPRHGFVDSIVCKTSSELNSLSSLTKEIEPEAEILITKPINSSYNAIINGGVITFAPGNDGATSGKGCKYFYIGEDPLANILDLSKTNLVASGEVPFYELVLEKGSDKPIHLVQVRSAPQTPRVKDYIPSITKVERIIKAEGDLLDWESLLKEVDPKTTIVDHTSGSLSSHYAIHAIVNKVPIFTSYLPDIGSILEPTVETTEMSAEMKDAFYNAFILGFNSLNELMKNYLNQKFTAVRLMRDVIILSLATLHNYSSIALSNDYEVLGIVLGMFCRVAFTISMGEARYAGNITSAHKIPIFSKFLEKYKSNAVRNSCYHISMEESMVEFFENIKLTQKIFLVLPWDSNFGGKKWASCTDSVISLFNACVNKEIDKVVELFNRVINEEHNGGKYLNKVIDTSLFDSVAVNTSLFTLEHLHLIIDLLYSGWNCKSLNHDLFKPIIIDSVEELKIKLSKKMSLEEKVKNVKLLEVDPDCVHKSISLFNDFKQEDGKLASLTKLYDSENESYIELPKPFYVSGCWKSCCSKNYIKLYSAPLWWCLSNGTPVISKSKLTKLTKKNN